MTAKLSEKIHLLGFIAIAGVVYIHATTAAPRFQTPASVIEGELNASSFLQFFIGNGLARFCIPLFFMISGYFFFYAIESYSFREYLLKLRKRVRTLLIPFIFWSLFGYFGSRLLLYVPFFAESVPFPGYDFSLPKILHFLQLMIHTGISIQLWFIVQLMIMVLFSYPLYWILRNWITVPVAIMLFLFFYKVWLGPVQLPIVDIRMYLSTEAVLFFSLGSVLAIHNIDLEKPVSRTKVMIFLAFWTLLLAAKTILNYRYSLPALHNILVLLGLPCVWFGYDYLVASNQRLKQLLNRGAEHSFLIYVAHLPFLTIMTTAMLHDFGDSPGKSLAGFLILPIVFIVVLVFIGQGLKRVWPGGYSLVTGGRG